MPKKTIKTIAPAEDYLFAEALEQGNEVKRDSGLFIQKSQDEMAKRSLRVINIGKGVEGIEKDDIILYTPTVSSANIKLNEKEYILVHKSQILGVIKEVEVEA